MQVFLIQLFRFLALVCLLRNETFEKHGLIDYNFQCFNTAILQVLELCKKSFDDKAGENANQVALNGSHPSQDNNQSPVL
jgi:Ras-related GTP-binding protein C/D